MSGRKNALNNFKIANAVSMAADITSTVTNIQFMDNIGIQMNFTGDAVGPFYVQISADYQQNAQGVVTNAGNWVNLVLDPIPAATGTGGSIYIDMTQLSAPWIRLFYDRTSGTGTLNAFIVGKMI